MKNTKYKLGGFRRGYITPAAKDIDSADSIRTQCLRRVNAFNLISSQFSINLPWNDPE